MRYRVIKRINLGFSKNIIDCKYNYWKMVYTIKETESLSMKGGKSQLSTAVLEDCKTEPSSMVK